MTFADCPLVPSDRNKYIEILKLPLPLMSDPTFSELNQRQITAAEQLQTLVISSIANLEESFKDAIEEDQAANTTDPAKRKRKRMVSTEAQSVTFSALEKRLEKLRNNSSRIVKKLNIKFPSLKN